MFNKADIMEDKKKRKLVRMFKMVGEALTVRHFTNNNLVPMPGKASAEDTKKYMLWLPHLGFGKVKPGQQKNNPIGSLLLFDRERLSAQCRAIVDRKTTKAKLST